ncbi:MAG: hypothetical protein K6G83_00130 [Lachnospiraceae bacterium]|nr:hypothetical protein [Lachnospiraceae bacterium]
MSSEEYLDSLLRSVTNSEPEPAEKTIIRDEPAKASLSDFVSDLMMENPSEPALSQGTDTPDMPAFQPEEIPSIPLPAAPETEMMAEPMPSMPEEAMQAEEIRAEYEAPAPESEILPEEIPTEAEIPLPDEEFPSEELPTELSVPEEEIQPEGLPEEPELSMTEAEIPSEEELPIPEAEIPTEAENPVPEEEISPEEIEPEPELSAPEEEVQMEEIPAEEEIPPEEIEPEPELSAPEEEVQMEESPAEEPPMEPEEAIPEEMDFDPDALLQPEAEAVSDLLETLPEDEAANMSDSDLEDLLSSLDNMGDPSQSSEEIVSNFGLEPSGEGNESDPEQSGTEPQPEEEAPSDTPASGEDNDDDRLGQEEIEALLSQAAGDGEEPDMPDVSDDLMDLLADGEGDQDISDIGDLLSKDENHEAIDPAMAMAMEDTEGAADALLDEINGTGEDETPAKEDRKAARERKKKEKQAKKEQKRLEKLKKKGKKTGTGEEGENGDSFEQEMAEALAEGLIDQDSFEELQEEKKSEESKKKKGGFFAKIIDALTEEVDEDEEKFAEETAVDIAKTGASDNEKILEELEAGDAPAEKKEKPKKKKKEKKKKEKPKKEKKPKPAKPQKPKKPTFINTGPDLNVPKKKVLLVMFMCLSLGVLVGIMSVVIPFYADMNHADEKYDQAAYDEVFMDLTGHKLSKDEQALYDKNLILYKVTRRYQSYQNYMALNMQVEALNSLVQGIRVIDEEERKALELGITSQFDMIAEKIIDSLNSVFGVSVEQAQAWLAIPSSEEYSRTLERYLEGGAPVGTDPSLEPIRPVDNGAPGNALVEAEEAEFEGGL